MPTGTPKQAATLIDLENRYRRSNQEPPFTAEQEARARAHVLASDLAAVRRMFDDVNARLGFDRRTSRATPEQLAVLRRMEQRVGAPLTDFRAGLSFEQAHRRIEALKGVRS